MPDIELTPQTSPWGAQPRADGADSRRRAFWVQTWEGTIKICSAAAGTRQSSRRPSCLVPTAALQIFMVPPTPWGAQLDLAPDACSPGVTPGRWFDIWRQVAPAERLRRTVARAHHIPYQRLITRPEPHTYALHWRPSRLRWQGRLWGGHAWWWRAWPQGLATCKALPPRFAAAPTPRPAVAAPKGAPSGEPKPMKP